MQKRKVAQQVQGQGASLNPMLQPNAARKPQISNKKLKVQQDSRQSGSRSNQAPSVADSDAHEMMSDSASAAA